MTDTPDTTMGEREKLAELPLRLSAEMACILEDCGPPENQKDVVLAALIEMYQPMWDRLIEVAALRSPPSDAGEREKLADDVDLLIAVAKDNRHSCELIGIRIRNSLAFLERVSTTLRSPPPIPDGRIAREALEYIEMAESRLRDCPECKQCVEVAISYLAEARAALSPASGKGEPG